ncbi:MAG: AmmeMemoRadiSam system protein B [Spirochaetales bacterium]|nr:AmmeMemoRadiSam system protein B [Spirochaetales bacterium]
MANLVRHPHFEDIFYPSNKNELAALIAGRMSEWTTGYETLWSTPPRGLLVPHGGYEYCGELLGGAFAQLSGFPSPERVVILSPELSPGAPGIKLPVSSVFVSPLGKSRVDREFCDSLTTSSMSIFLDETPHLQEYTIEYLLPFLHFLYQDIPLVPLLVQHDSTIRIAKTLTSALAIAQQEIGGTSLIVGVSNTTRLGKPQETEVLGTKIQHFLLHYSGGFPDLDSEEYDLVPSSFWNWLVVLDFLRSLGRNELKVLGCQTSPLLEEDRVVQYSCFRVD